MKSTPLNASPPKLALARGVKAIPKPDALPGGCRYEPKWDGYRIAIVRTEDSTVLWSRQGKDLTRYLPGLAYAAEDQIPPSCIVDGEAVIWTKGRLNFEALQQRITASKADLYALVRERPASFAAFDLLQAAGTDARGLAFQDRRDLLEELASWWEPPLDLSPVTDDFAKATTWFETMPTSGIEGLVVKGADQPYEHERIWLKVKHRDTLDVVCAAVIGSRERPATIIAGLPINGKLWIVGRTSPLKATASKSLGRLLSPPAGDHPWPNEVRSTAIDRFNSTEPTTQLTLVEPIIVEVSADTAFSGRTFRHPLRFLRVRPELHPDEVSSPFDKR
ncbi:ATP-dependent DNA ligase [Arthrobacter sp. Soil782]|uniref:ATP-dependent DNA ligase n=1 Tax=Arthrobacter sp. Soil782 TaxID=1736410 RepID=UPI0006FD5059|nr:ATP-dependent DNA ligase [Arthrobacter sp. Soil782]KRF04358.1 ATP-dependent DNA ligase [Arthrobacter sp. Soil782]